MLCGPLGAGKTTLAQGIGAGLGVRGEVTSPTFVIAREHPSTSGGPGLVHVDAYRLGSLAEVDDLDLDSAIAESITVVEWGSGLVEALAASRLEVRLVRGRGAGEDQTRLVQLTGHGPRWTGVELPDATR
jgi:tRNA threonylcarbamoyladenosine biosynthesis protein TsaE